MFTPPIELSLGESFIYGDFDIEGDIFAAFTSFNVIFRRNLLPASRDRSLGCLVTVPSPVYGGYTTSQVIATTAGRGSSTWPRL